MPLQHNFGSTHVRSKFFIFKWNIALYQSIALYSLFTSNCFYTLILYHIFRWSCRKDLSVSGPAVLSVSIPSGFILDESQRKSLINSGSNVWTEGSEIIFFFEKVMIYRCNNHRKHSTKPNLFINLATLFIITAHNGFHMRKLHTTQELSRGELVTLHTDQNLWLVFPR